jgi:hypothetical protein
MSARWPAASAFRSFSPNARLQCPIERIDLDAAAVPAGALGGKYGRAAPTKGIENDIIALRRIKMASGHRDRLVAIAPEAAELNIVEVRFFVAVSKKEHKFMPGPVK